MTDFYETQFNQVLPTIRVRFKDGSEAVINERDFDPATEEVITENTKAQGAAKEVVDSNVSQRTSDTKAEAVLAEPEVKRGAGRPKKEDSGPRQAK